MLQRQIYREKFHLVWQKKYSKTNHILGLKITKVNSDKPYSKSSLPDVDIRVCSCVSACVDLKAVFSETLGSETIHWSLWGVRGFPFVARAIIGQKAISSGECQRLMAPRWSTEIYWRLRLSVYWPAKMSAISIRRQGRAQIFRNKDVD